MLKFIGASSQLQQLLCLSLAATFWITLLRGRAESNNRLVVVYIWTLVAWPAAYSILSGTLSPATSTLLSVGFQYAPAMVAGFFLLVSAGGGARLHAGVLMVCLVPVMSVVYALGSGQASAWSLVWLSMAAPACVTRQLRGGPESVVHGLRLSLVSVWLLISVLAVLRPTETFQPCRLDKCSMVGTFLAPGGVSNGLGVTFALMLPLAVYRLPWRPLLLAGAGGLLAIDYTGSRSALIAGVAGLAFVAASRLRLRPARRLAAGGLVLAATVATLVPVLHSFPVTTATYRGSLWIRAKVLIHAQPLVGHGPSYWVRQTATSEVVSNYSAHNIWLEILVATGFVGCTALVLGTLVSLRRTERAFRPLVLTGIVTILGCGVFEAPVMPYRLSLSPGIFIALLLVTGMRSTVAPPAPPSAAPVRHPGLALAHA